MFNLNYLQYLNKKKIQNKQTKIIYFLRLNYNQIFKKIKFNQCNFLNNLKQNKKKMQIYKRIIDIIK